MPVTIRATLALAMLLALPARAAEPSTATDLDPYAERFVRLVLAIGEHDTNMVDAYYGPAQWREDAKARKASLETLEKEARQLADELASLQTTNADAELRRRGLVEQLASVRTRVEVVRGVKFTFDEEARRIYGVQPPHHDDEFYRAIHRELDAALPGKGTLAERMRVHRDKLILSPRRLQAGLAAGLGVCRGATLAHTALPPGESFRLELVKNRPWGAYNWYQGGYQSLIQVNTSLPSRANGMAGLMCHEGYPGHHVLNTLLEQKLVKGRRWVEYTVYPLYSAMSLLAEGSADFGLELVFPGDTRQRWEKGYLYPHVGLDPALADVAARVRKLADDLAYSGIDAARAYLDGERSAEQTIAWLQEFTFATRDEARRSIAFFDTYRSYVVNYRLGEDLVKQHVDMVAGADADARWAAFVDLISSPPIISDLARGTSFDPANAAR